jgi:hypothetical protein
MAMAMALDMRPAEQRRQRIKEKIGMKRTLTILSAALFAGALMVPAAHAQAPAASSSMAAPAAEATPSAKKHHTKHHHKKKSTSTDTSGAMSSPAAPSGQ